MMKKIMTIMFLMLLSIVATAQVRFGYISYKDVVLQMPQYANAQKQLAELKEKYDAEATRQENEFQKKFAEFLQGQKDFPANIMQKRQAELQDIMERGIAFRKEAEELLKKAEADLMQDIYNQLNAAITAVGMQQKCAFILNTDGNACPYIDPTLGDDITDLVRVRLGILKSLPIEKLQPANADKQPDNTGQQQENSELLPAKTEQQQQNTEQLPANAEQQQQNTEQQPANAEQQQQNEEQPASNNREAE